MADLRKKIQIEVDAKTRKAQRAFVDLEKKTDDSRKSVERLTAEEKQLQDRLSRVTNETRLLNLQLANKRARLREVEASSRGLVQRLGTMKASMVGWGLAIGGAVLAMDRLVQRSFALQNVQANLPFSIDKAKEAASGLTDEFQLARLAVQANRLEVAKTPEEFARVVEAAKRLGASVGRDVPDSIERLVQGLGKGEQELLDELGIVTKAAEAHDLYADRIGKTANTLTDAEKKQAVMTIRLEEAERKAKDVTFAVDEGTQAWLEAKQTLKDIGNDVIPFVTQSFAGLLQIIDGTSDGIANLIIELQGLPGFDQKTTNRRGVLHATDLSDPNAPGTQAVIAVNRAKRRKEQQQQAADALAASLTNVEMSRTNSLIAQAQHANELALRRARKIHDDKLMGRGGKKRDPFKSERAAFKLELGEAKNVQSFSAFSRGENAADPFSPENLKIQEEAHQAHVDKVISLEAVKQERLLQTRLNAIEVSKEAGADPMTLINREEEARKAFLEAEIERAEKQGDIVQAERLRGEVEQVEHDARLRRLAEEKRAREQQMQTLLEVGQITVGVHQNMAQSANDLAAAFGASSSKQEKIFRATQASIMVVRGITEAVEAIAAFARYDYGAGALHLSASVGAFAAAAKIGSAGGGGRSVGSTPGAFTGSQFGGGGTTGGRQGSGRSGDFNDIPLSTDTNDAQQDAQNGGGGRSANGNTYVFQKGSIMSLGSIDTETGIKLKQGIDKAERRVGGIKS